MKHTLLTALLLLGSMSAAYAQTERVTFATSPLTIEDICNVTERQTDYRISFSSRDINPTTQVQVPVNSSLTIADLMHRVLTGTHCTYIIHGKNILIFKAEYLSTIKSTQTRSEHGEHLFVNPSSETDEVFIYPDHSKIIDRNAGRKSTPDAMRPYYNHLYPRLYLKTDLLYAGASLTPNLSIEVGVGKRSTLDFTVGYNPWNRNSDNEQNRKFVHLLAKGEYRYWLCERFDGHFFGANLLFSSFNISNLDLKWLGFDKEYRHQGRAYGAGVSYGYLWNWSRRWGMELNVGVGAVWRKYGRYDCIKCGDKIDDKKEIYYGPTAVGIKLVYKLK
ncbi:MAG: DUF3575 domain-containing protein [Mediterranea sp.]|jgi:hypothetical protein|nr:DUF3575 domain-containing protein [Mediterranea sp.]